MEEMGKTGRSMKEAVAELASRQRKWIITAAVLTVIALCAAVGVYLYLDRFDAGEYVKAMLDVSYKDETALYMEITGATEEEAGSVFEDNLDATMEGFEASDMPEEMQPEYRELFGEIAKRVSYTVGEPVRQEDGTYAVEVKVKPITLFPDTYASFQLMAQDYADQVTESVMQGGEMPSDEEMRNEIYQIYYNVLKDQVDAGMLYGEAQEITLHVTKEGFREFLIDREDMDSLDGMLIESVGQEN